MNKYLIETKKLKKVFDHIKKETQETSHPFSIHLSNIPLHGLVWKIGNHFHIDKYEKCTPTVKKDIYLSNRSYRKCPEVAEIYNYFVNCSINV